MRAGRRKGRSERAGTLLYQEAQARVLTTKIVVNFNSDALSEKRVHHREPLKAVSSTVLKFLKFSQEES